MSEPPKEFKQKYMELQILQHQMQQVQQQSRALEAQAGEMDVVLEALDEFSKSKADSAAFVTLTPGLLVKAKIVETDKVLLNVGGGAVVEKSIPDAKNVIAGQVSELRTLQEELTDQLKKFSEKAKKVQEELRVLLK